jgi:hypothetical protein
LRTQRLSHGEVAGDWDFKVKKKAWSEADCERLKAFVASSASPLRSSVALKRSVRATKNKARELGAPFRTESEMKKDRRQIFDTLAR